MLDADPQLTRAEIARRLGISRAAVTQALRRYDEGKRIDRTRLAKYRCAH